MKGQESALQPDRDDAAQRDRDDAEWLDRERAQWQRAMRWRRGVEQALDQVGLKFNDWLVLEATQQLTREKRDAVSQNEVGRALGFTRMQVSVAMRRLAELGFVDRGPDMTGWVWRVFVTTAGAAQLADARARVSRAARSEAR